MSYGYPSGVDLVNKIIGGISRRWMDSQLNESHKRYFTYSIDDLREFQSRLSGSGVFSVDAFLEKPNNKTFIELGKLLIAEHLLPCESPDIPPSDGSDDWYRYLVHRIQENLSGKTPKKEPLTIITFNYDRSLDEYLRTRLQTLFGYTPEESNKAFSNLKIIHVHGMMSALPWQGSQNEKGRAYGSSTIGEWPLIAYGIKIIHEGNSADPAFVEARRHLEAANRIFFLGFHYHQPNLERLLAGSWMKRGEQRTIWGSTYGMETSEISTVMEQFDLRFYAADNGRKCLKALRQFSDALS